MLLFRKYWTEDGRKGNARGFGTGGKQQRTLLGPEVVKDVVFMRLLLSASRFRSVHYHKSEKSRVSCLGKNFIRFLSEINQQFIQIE